MDKFMARVVAAAVLFAAASLAASAQGLDRKDVRSGNRHFSKEKYREAIVDYQKALLRDSTSFAASYNLANALYRTGNFTEAGSVLDSISGRADESGYAADYHYNAGNTALALKDYQAAVDSYRAALLRNPGDLDAKENYIYARKKLEHIPACRSFPEHDVHAFPHFLLKLLRCLAFMVGGYSGSCICVESHASDGGRMAVYVLPGHICLFKLVHDCSVM